MSRWSDRELGMDRSITRRDLFHGAAVVEPRALRHRQPTGYGRDCDTSIRDHLPTRAHRPARQPSRLLRNRSRPRPRRQVRVGPRSRHRGADLRPGSRRCRRERARGRLVLPQGRARGPHPPARQPRRLRRPRQAQRVRSRRGARCSATAGRRRWRRPAATATLRKGCCATSASISIASPPPTTRVSIRRHGLAAAIYFDADTFGVDRVVRHRSRSLEAWIPVDGTAPATVDAVASFPIDEEARRQIHSLYSGEAGRRFPEWRKWNLVQLSYVELLARLGVDHPQALKYFDGMPAPLACVGNRRHSSRVRRLLRPAQSRRTASRRARRAVHPSLPRRQRVGGAPPGAAPHPRRDSGKHAWKTW